MIVTRIDGGLGNQMFQYAYGWYLARRHGTQLWLDIDSYDKQPAHGYLLDQYKIEGQPLPPKCRPKVPRQYRSAAASHLGIAHWLGLGCLRRHKEKPFGFHPKHLHTPNERYLVGYWQSEQFFPNMRPELLQQFQLANPVSPQTQRIAEHMLSVTSAAIHVRRGDYLNASAAGIYQQLQLDYYRRSLQDWAQSHSGVEVFVFSNDMPWCHKHLRLPWKTTWIDHHHGRPAQEDLWLMSQAACCVIANSTFSWWAAWLNDRSNKSVYAPAAWFQPGTLDGSHLIPQAWKQMELCQAAEASQPFAVQHAA